MQQNNLAAGPTETWMPLPFVGRFVRYEASDHGKIRSVSASGKVHLLRLWVGSKGYLHATILNTNKAVHRLVLIAFDGPDRDLLGLHNDGCKQNNCLTNLRWGTYADNIADQKLHGTWREGGDHSQAAVSDKDAEEIRKLYASESITQAALAARFGLAPQTVSKIVRGVRYGKSSGTLLQSRQKLMKLGAEDIVSVRKLLASGMSQMKVSKLFDVSRSLIAFVDRGERRFVT